MAMDNPQGQSTSFIPQRPSRGKVKKGGVRKIYILSYVSYVFFFFSLITVGGIYFYEFTLTQQLEQQKARLAEERNRFNQTDIQRIKDIDNRIDAVHERLDQHLAVSNIFVALEDVTIDPISYLDFSYDRTLGNVPRVTFTGFASDYDAILFQREVIKQSEVLGGVSVDNVSYNTRADVAQGNTIDVTRAVAFTLTSTLDEGSIQYQPQRQDVTPTPQQFIGEQQTNVEIETNDAVPEIEEEEQSEPEVNENTQ